MAIENASIAWTVDREQKLLDTAGHYYTLLMLISLVDLLIILLGTAGNMCSLYLLTRNSFTGARHNVAMSASSSLSSMRYLAMLTLVDTACLYGWYLSSVYRQLFGHGTSRLENLSPALCKLIAFASFASLQLSSVLLCTLTVDRLLAIVSSTWRAKFANARFAVKLTLVEAACIVVLNSSVPFRFGERRYDNQAVVTAAAATANKCYDDTNEFQLMWNKLHLALYSLVPFPLLCVLNLIVIRVATYGDLAAAGGHWRLHLRRGKHTDPKQQHGPHLTPPTSHIVEIQLNPTSTNVAGHSKRRGSGTHAGFVTPLLVFLTFSFLFTTLPSTVVYAFWHASLLKKPHGRVILNLLNTLQVCTSKIATYFGAR